MGQGRVIALVALLVLILSHTHLSRAATYTVGWTFSVENWPIGKTFRAGDTIVFKYTPGTHNVVVNNKDGYQKCTTPSGAKVLTSGNDKITLVKGPNYFSCNFKGHCESAMKIAVTAI